MGMFDSTFVAKELLDPVIAGATTKLELEAVNGYYSFQTKDLDNCLTNFYIRQDGSFCWEKQEYAYNDSGAQAWSSAEPVGDPQYIEDTRTAYLDFYDFYYTDHERIFVTFTAHVKEGKLAEPIKVKDIEVTNLEEEAIKNKKAREEWNRVTSTWQWRLATYMCEAKWKLKRWFYPLTKKLDELDSYLRKEAKKGTSLEQNQYGS
jgi:hypothetical protein